MIEHSSAVALPEPGEWLNEYGDSLYRYALARLGRSHDAEEVVQETLLAALKARAQFEGRSQPLTWLTGILKRKIVDRIRAADTEAELDSQELDTWFDAGGHWRKSPRRWGDPAESAERAEFWRVVRSCLG